MELKYLNHKDFDIEVEGFSPYLEKLSTTIDLKEGILNIVFVNDAYIHALNKAYRDKDKSTDVLSFIYEQDGLLGEVYISIETAGRQAEALGHSLADEIIRLMVHGILHVHGFDHEEDKDYEVMFAIEKGVLGALAGEKIMH